MFSKVIPVTVLLATMATAQSQNTVVNWTPQDIQYGYTGPYDAMLGSGVILANGGSVNFDLGPSRNVKMCFTCSNPAGASSDIYQFEYDYESGSNSINYDWSDINGPDDFSAYQRTIQPSSSACPVITCAPGDDSSDCEFTTTTDYNPPNCNAGTAATVLTATIGTPPSKARRHTRSFRV